MSKEEKIKRLNCYMDLYRAATWYYKNPKGNVHLIFLKHGIKVLKELNADEQIRKCTEVGNKMVKSKSMDINLADKLLTYGIMIKG